MIAFALSALGFLKRLPWQVYAAIGAALALWLALDAAYDNGLAKGRRELADAVATYEAAQADALAANIAARAATEQRYQELAERADDEHAATQAAAMDATDRYIAARRVPSCAARSDGSGTIATPDDLDPGISSPVPAGIVMGEADVRACAAIYAYSIGAHDWAAGLAGE